MFLFQTKTIPKSPASAEFELIAKNIDLSKLMSGEKIKNMAPEDTAAVKSAMNKITVEKVGSRITEFGPNSGYWNTYRITVYNSSGKQLGAFNFDARPGSALDQEAERAKGFMKPKESQKSFTAAGFTSDYVEGMRATTVTIKFPNTEALDVFSGSVRVNRFGDGRIFTITAENESLVINTRDGKGTIFDNTTLKGRQFNLSDVQMTYQVASEKSK